ncbi:UbiD family decarboxylase [Ramlibacter rhizophilus]|uniref:UbiD family decarboxylase n=1 Tax=Ramlibacter rhizophilus TaxID=1781167 RepID=A0A4Z0BR49_9BURK|nr:UbiD family decarboxylase [Ramlibacter rhizophilus]TFZ01301.1 UbiD family decarboxylase [Ramlibacter rhizophilus]
MNPDFQAFFAAYRERHPEDVLVIREPISGNQVLTALVQELAREGRRPVVLAERVEGLDVPVVTNLFGSRERVARMLGVEVGALHATYQARSRERLPPRRVERGPVMDIVQEGDSVDLHALPLLRHFQTDRGPYITNAVMVGQHPDTGAGNLSYHRSMVHAKNQIATSLHSRGDLWRLLQLAAERGQPLPVAMVIGAHPLFMLAASARVPFGTDEREVAGGLMGAPLDMVATPRHGILVPADAQFVLEGTIDPSEKAEEGPFGEFTGYSSDRSTHNLLRVDTLMRRKDAVLIDVLGGQSDEHLNLGRIPREAEMAEKLMQRFPGVTGLHYPNSGTHFHAYVAVRQMRPGEARQVMLGLLGWDPYLKTVVAVDPDVDITRDEQVLWALAAHFQPHRDLLVIDGLPGSALDPSASGQGTTSRMGLDATRGPQFEGVKAQVAPEALERARQLLRKV